MMTYEEFRDKFHIRLTDQQTEAVRAVEGPTLLLAVPGSGKTTVLVARLGYMIYCAGIPFENILTLTYTVAATRDMAARFAERFGEEIGRRMEFRTINGVCAKIIDYYSQSVGKSPFSLVTDEKRIAGMLSAIYQRVEGGYATEGDLKGIRTLIAYIKNSMLDETEIKKLEQDSDWRISEIYRLYREELRARGLMDYDDQMLYAGNILARSPETLEYFRRRFPYICVDEAQDTSRIQHAIIRRLAGGRDNLFMVGDEDQSIYGFRAAYPQALLSFEQEHPGARVLLMEENFRSCAQIVEAADCFIQKNVLRHAKRMRASRPAGADIREIPLKGRGAQYTYLAKVAEECRIQTAVLYRDNESALPLIDLLERRGIPYRIRNADMAFFTHRVVQDIRNIILFASNPKDTELFLQIYYKMSSYINRQAAQRICEISEKKDMDVLEAAIRFGRLEEKTVSSCRAVRLQFRSLLSDSAEAALDRIAQEMGYRDYLRRAGVSDGKLAILRAIAHYEDSPLGLVERLDVLRRTVEEKKYDAGCPFLLSTIHASKGLEYDRVYLMDVADGIFPEAVPEREADMDEKERQAYEEERRLFYVAMTRAKDMLSVFGLNRKSVFRTELFARMKYQRFRDAIGEGLIVRHKKFGEGVIVEEGKNQVLIQFGSRQRRLDLKTLYEQDLLIL